MKTLLTILLLTGLVFIQINGQPIGYKYVPIYVWNDTTEILSYTIQGKDTFMQDEQNQYLWYNPYTWSCIDSLPVYEFKVYYIHWWDKYSQELSQDSTMQYFNKSFCVDYEWAIQEIELNYFKQGKYYLHKVKNKSSRWTDADSCYQIVYYTKEQPTFEGFINWLKNQ